MITARTDEEVKLVRLRVAMTIASWLGGEFSIKHLPIIKRIADAAMAQEPGCVDAVCVCGQMIALEVGGFLARQKTRKDMEEIGVQSEVLFPGYKSEEAAIQEGIRRYVFIRSQL